MLECSDCAAILGDYLRPKFFMVLEKENLQAANVKEIIAQTVAVLIMLWIALFVTIASIQYGNAFKPDDGHDAWYDQICPERGGFWRKKQKAWAAM
ncbi:hypothetical protein [Carboxydocella sp. ULO1]|uniref:hypothetical protein n=1 Tax=Carboxydocella sp. ULO1 TaxID=1926599 RepID=UPI0009AEFBF1|nr:hypothetical protein [Carboxydocella sp. ULO1]GAW28383.1 hypothetical protein ULO1_09530 [Carboxydocella sp. ULO1]